MSFYVLCRAWFQLLCRGTLCILCFCLCTPWGFVNNRLEMLLVELQQFWSASPFYNCRIAVRIIAGSRKLCDVNQSLAWSSQRTFSVQLPPLCHSHALKFRDVPAPRFCLFLVLRKDEVLFSTYIASSNLITAKQWTFTMDKPLTKRIRNLK